MYDIKLRSAKGNVVIAEIAGLREWFEPEVVHFRADEDNDRCGLCMVRTGPLRPWLSDRGVYNTHPKRCEVM